MVDRIRALKDFSDVKRGDLGGFVWSESNLNEDGTCWIYDNALVYDFAWVGEYAQVRGNSQVFGDAQIYGHGIVSGNAQVSGRVWVCDGGCISGDAIVTGVVSIFGHISGDACVSGGVNQILSGIEIDHGVWIQRIWIAGKAYLISNTLELIYTMR